MADITIGSNTYASYATVADADVYAAAAIHAVNWATATTDQKAIALVTATRLLNRQRWKGDVAAGLSPTPALVWPRTNTGIEGVADDAIPQDIIAACIELAIGLLDGSTVQTDQSTAQAIQTLRAGSVSLTYFRGAEGAPLRFPLIVWELIRDYLLGAGLTLATSMSFGTDGESVTANDFGIGP